MMEIKNEENLPFSKGYKTTYINKKQLRPNNIYCNDKEFELTSYLVTLAASGVFKIKEEWKEIAIPYHKRLTKLIIKKNVQKTANKDIPNI